MSLEEDAGLFAPPPENAEDRVILFFDIDNTLYSKRDGVAELMGGYIRAFIKTQLKLDDESAEMLHKTYYKDFGLAIEGLVRFNHIDAMDYNAKVDDALPLDTIIKPDPELRKLLEAVDRSKVRLWLFTNAYVNHARRVIRLLKLEGIFEGVTFCDYRENPLVCKPKPQMFDRALEQAGITDIKKAYYVDDSALNVQAAADAGWKHAIHYIEDEESRPTVQAGHDTVGSLWQLQALLPWMFTHQLKDPHPFAPKSTAREV